MTYFIKSLPKKGLEKSTGKIYLSTQLISLIQYFFSAKALKGLIISKGFFFRRSNVALLTFNLIISPVCFTLCNSYFFI